MKRHTRRSKTVINGDHAIELLYPIAALLRSGGMNTAQSLAAFAAALDYVRRSDGRRALDHIGASTCYPDLIATWSRERKFLDSQGRPRPLPISGTNGFNALVKTTGARQDPKRLLAVLIRYKNVRRLRDGRVQLVSPLFRASAGQRIAFEPISHFLADATSTLTHILNNVRAPRTPDLFWRSVESIHVSRANAWKFTEFAKERSLLFLEELDDWLDAHEGSKSGNPKRQLRIGLGLFSIYSRPSPLPCRSPEASKFS
jgi:hypothetical protein